MMLPNAAAPTPGADSVCPDRQPKFRSYYRRLHHRAAIAAMSNLVLIRPDYDRRVVATEAIALADALVDELKRTDPPGDDIED